MIRKAAELLQRLNAADWRMDAAAVGDFIVAEAGDGQELAISSANLQSIHRSRKWQRRSLPRQAIEALSELGLRTRTDRLRFVLSYLGLKRLTARAKAKVRPLCTMRISGWRLRARKKARKEQPAQTMQISPVALATPN
jgi:hypothetical protein